MITEYTCVDEAYHDTMGHIWYKGTKTSNRTGIDTTAVFGMGYKVPVRHDRPVLQRSKAVYTKTALKELQWFLSGDTRLGPLKELGVGIWDQWVKPDTAIYDHDGVLSGGDLGPIYQHQWRHWSTPTGEIDQLQVVTDSLRNDPTSRRHIVSAWNPADLAEMALPPCHMFFQFSTTPVDSLSYVDTVWLDEWAQAARAEGILSEDYIVDRLANPRELDLLLYMRSNDMGLGHPFNVFQYSVIQILMSRSTGLLPGVFTWTGGDCHIYEDQKDVYLHEHYRKYDSDHFRNVVSKSVPYIEFATGKVANALLDFKHNDLQLKDYVHMGPVQYPKAAK